MIEENILFTDKNICRTELDLKRIDINIKLMAKDNLLVELLAYIIELSNNIL